MTGEWVLVSPHRGKRPWLGQVESAHSDAVSNYAADCYLCPGNLRINGEKNPIYTGTFAFTNDFSALSSDTPQAGSDDPLFAFQSEQGLTRVVCFSPDHSKTMAELNHQQIEAVINCWIDECRSISSTYPWIAMFENKGTLMGCSMPHPHSQIWAQKHAPTIHDREAVQQTNYYQTRGSALLLDYCEREVTAGERVVVANSDWLVVVPYWAAWPYETLVLPRFPVSRLDELTPTQTISLADVMSQITVRYDNLFQCSFPYSMGWHGAPYDGNSHREWQLHAHYYPPLIRSSSIRKFMVGYEMLAEPQRDMTPEQAAQSLRNLPAVHYKQASA